MHITWHGEYTIRLQTGEHSVIIDPYAPDSGLHPFRSRADTIALSNPASKHMSHLAGIQGSSQVINTPGEFNIHDMTLHALGWRSTDGNERNLQRWQIEGMVLLHLGALERDLTTGELQELEKTDIDILFLPIGGGESLSTSQALKLLTTIEPKVVIPIHFQLPKLKHKLETVERFSKEMGVSASERQPKLVMKAAKLPQEEMATVILMP